MTLRALCLLLPLLICCSGRPTFDARQEALTSALHASLDQLNSQSWSKNLLRISRTRGIRVNPSLQVTDPKDVGEVFEVTLQFSVRETTCNKNTGNDHSDCKFLKYMEIPCESHVLVSRGKTLVLKARCNLRTSSSSESYSSEEIFMRTPNNVPGSLRTNTEKYPSQWDLYGSRIQKLNPHWEEEEEKILDHFLLE